MTRLRQTFCGFVLWLLAGTGWGADFADHFGDRQLLAATSATILGSNVGATVEPGEPRHGRKAGGHSVWLSWSAPANGLLRLRTEGSSFDTLLGVYTMESGDDPALERLRPAADGDDDGLYSYTEVALGVEGGQRYEIAVDGFSGATGEIRLQVEFVASGSALPTVVRTPGDQAPRPGDPLILTVDLVAVKDLELRWYLNQRRVDDAEEPTLVIPRLDPTHTGLYELEVRLDDLAFRTAPIEIQLNTEGAAGVLARNKFIDATESGLAARVAGASVGRRAALAALGAGVSRGYNGSQVFNTAFATRDPAEPQHCGVPGGPSYWLMYQPPASGTLSLDTEGSDYDTLLAVYTYDPPLTGYESLQPVACDNNHGTDGRAARVTLPVESTRTYFIVVDGVNGQRGIAHLNYALTAVEAPSPQPRITSPPASQLVAVGSTIALTVYAVGAPPLQYQWWRDGTPLPGQTNGSLTLMSVLPEAAGTYQAVVANAFGQVTSDPATLTVCSRPSLFFDAGTGRVRLAFPAPRGYQYRLETAAELLAAPWTLVQTVLADGGNMVQLETNPGPADRRFYRLLRP